MLLEDFLGHMCRSLYQSTSVCCLGRCRSWWFVGKWKESVLCKYTTYHHVSTSFPFPLQLLSYFPLWCRVCKIRMSCWLPHIGCKCEVCTSMALGDLNSCWLCFISSFVMQQVRYRRWWCIDLNAMIYCWLIYSVAVVVVQVTVLSLWSQWARTQHCSFAALFAVLDPGAWSLASLVQPHSYAAVLLFAAREFGFEWHGLPVGSPCCKQNLVVKTISLSCKMNYGLEYSIC